MNSQKLTGLIAATYTPLDSNEELNTSAIGPMVDHLLASGVKGLYVCGSTGEGISLASNERKVVAHTFVEATHGRVPVIVQVGHNSLTEAKQLAAHAKQAGHVFAAANEAEEVVVGRQVASQFALGELFAETDNGLVVLVHLVIHDKVQHIDLKTELNSARVLHRIFGKSTFAAVLK